MQSLKFHTLTSCIALLLLAGCQNQTSTPGLVSAQNSADSHVPDLTTGGLSESEWLTEVSKLNQAYFDAVDANHDGALTLAEAKVVYPEVGLKSLNDFYPDLDINKDGIWQSAEFSKYMNEFIKIKGKADANSPEFITTVYLIKATDNRTWDALDNNQDGTLSLEELYSSYVSDKGAICRDGESCNEPTIIQQAKDGLKDMDTNGDSKVSYAEFQRHEIKSFTNHILAVVKQSLNPTQTPATGSPQPVK